MIVAMQRLVVLLAAVVPALGVVAPKGIVLAVLVPGIAGLVLGVQKGFAAIPVDRWLTLSLAALAAWAAIATVWGPNPAGALLLVGNLVGLSLAGIGLVFAVSRLDEFHRRRTGGLLLVGIMLGMAALAGGYVYAKATGDSLWGSFFLDPLTTLNNGAVVISLLAWPACAALWRQGRVWIIALAAPALLAAFAFLSSGAALLAPLCGLAAFAVVWLFGRRGATALAAVFFAASLAAPLLVSSNATMDAAAKMAEMLPSSTQHRLKMWAFAVEKIDEKPLKGWGMDASRSIPQEDRRLSPKVEIMPLHPHNAFLQVRLELGLPGAAIVAVFLGIMFAAVIGGIGERTCRAFAAGAASAYLSVAAVSYGIWQNWWVAMAWALAALMAVVLRPASHKSEIGPTSAPATPGT
jgi:exopolysaccharide production protein ExoQ